MKRFLAIILSALMICCLTGCEELIAELEKIEEDVNSQVLDVGTENPDSPVSPVEEDNGEPHPVEFGGIVFDLPSYYPETPAGQTDTQRYYRYEKDGEPLAIIMFDTFRKEALPYSDFVIKKLGFPEKTLGDLDTARDPSLTLSRDFIIAGYASNLSAYSIKANWSTTMETDLAYINNTDANLIQLIYIIARESSDYDYVADFRDMLMNATAVQQEDEETPTEQQYEYAFIRDCTEYSLYYLIDEDQQTVRWFSTTDLGALVGTYTGNLTDGIEINFYNGKMIESIKYVSEEKLSVITIDSFGDDWVYKTIPVLAVEGYTHIEGFHDLEDI